MNPTTMNPTETRKNGVHNLDHKAPFDAAAEVLRDKMNGAVHQLDNLWDTMSSLERTAREHPRALIAAGSAMLLAVASGITLGILENHRRNTFGYKFQQSLKWAKGLVN